MWTSSRVGKRLVTSETGRNGIPGQEAISDRHSHSGVNSDKRKKLQAESNHRIIDIQRNDKTKYLEVRN